MGRVSVVRNFSQQVFELFKLFVSHGMELLVSNKMSNKSRGVRVQSRARHVLRLVVKVAYNVCGYEIVAEYEAKTFRTAQNYIRATT